MTANCHVGEGLQLFPHSFGMLITYHGSRSIPTSRLQGASGPAPGDWAIRSERVYWDGRYSEAGNAPRPPRIVRICILTGGTSMPKRTNDEWLADLENPGAAQEAALHDLRSIVSSGLSFALSEWLNPSDPSFEPLAEEVAQETLLRVLDKLDTFEGRSQFTTWVHKIAVRIALSELRRKRWKDVSLESLVEDEEGRAAVGLMVNGSAGPETAAEQTDLIARVRRVIEEELTEKQRSVIVASRIHGMPADEVARRMGMKRNALYKLMHDARLRLKQRLLEEGLTPEDVLSAFERG